MKVEFFYAGYEVIASAKAYETRSVIYRCPQGALFLDSVTTGDRETVEQAMRYIDAANKLEKDIPEIARLIKMNHYSTRPFTLMDYRSRAAIILEDS